jgi:hypothetical protein
VVNLLVSNGQPNSPATGTVTISSATPVEGQLLTLSQAIVDLDGIQSLDFTWQVEATPGAWIDVAVGTTFTPSDDVVNQRLRVIADCLDGVSHLETITSTPTGPVIPVNDPATGAPILSDTAPQVGRPVSIDRVAGVPSGIADVDGLPIAFQFEWQVDGVAIAGATGPSFTPSASQLGHVLSVTVSYTDNQGFPESLTSAPTAPVAAAPAAPPPATPPPATPPPSGGSPPTVTASAPSGGCASGGAGSVLALVIAAAALALRGRPRRTFEE